MAGVPSIAKQVVRAAGWAFGWMPGWYMVIVEPLARRLGSTETVTTGSGARIALDLGDFVQRKYFFRSYERRELRFMSRTLERGDLVIDVGANVGVLTVEAAGMVGPTGTVISAEPVPQNVRRLRDNAALNPDVNIVVLDVAVSDDPAPLVLGLSEGQLDRANAGAFTRGGGLVQVEVPTMSLDSIAAGHLPERAARLLKVDVEGMEDAVFRSAHALLERHRVDLVMYERIPGVGGGDVLASLSAHGYRSFRLGAFCRLHPVDASGPPESAAPIRYGLLASIVDWIRGRNRLETLIAVSPTLTRPI